MEALSYYSNMGALQQHDQFNSELLPPELLGCLSDDNFAFPDPSNNNIDYLFEPNEFFYVDENYLNPHQLLSSTPSFSAPNEPFLLQQEFEPFNCPTIKRQKLDFDYESINYFNDQLFPQLAPSPGLVPLPEYSSPLPDFQPPPPIYNVGSCESFTDKKPSLSAQSIAARQRRRKITDKTQELGKLIPGSQRMNTAEMFHAAYKYIKFLQAQVGVLQFMNSRDSKDENEDEEENEELRVLLESSMVQEKMYANEKCLVPCKLVQRLTSGDEDELLMFESKPRVLEEIRGLIENDAA